MVHFTRHCNLETGRNNPHKPKVCGRKRKTQVFSDELRNLIFITCIKYVLSDSRGTVWFMIKKKTRKSMPGNGTLRKLRNEQ